MEYYAEENHIAFQLLTNSIITTPFSANYIII
jgi:hypothetical protein